MMFIFLFFFEDYSCKQARITPLKLIQLPWIPLLFSTLGRFMYFLNRKILKKKKKKAQLFSKGSGFFVFPSLMLEISNSWGLFLSKMLKSNIPKEGGTIDREFAAILTLKSCNILGFITHKKPPKRLIRTISPSSFGARLTRAEWKATLSHCLKSRLTVTPTLGRATRCCAASEALPCFTPWNDAVNGVLLISLLVQTHWRKVESACFVAETDLQWCRLVSVSSESHHPTATAASTCTGEGGED